MIDFLGILNTNGWSLKNILFMKSVKYQQFKAIF